MPPKHQRRSHTKSKNGCSQCKIRRIKIICDFSLSPALSTSPLQDGDRTSICGPPSSGNGSQPVRPSVDPFQQPDLISTRKTTDLDVVDLRLMHHFTTVVALELANVQITESLALWQDHIIKLGFKHDFLLRGILAIAAFHMSYTYPDRKADYDLIGTTHQTLALSAFQETLTHVDESNCHALFAFSCIIIILAFASSTKDKPSDFATDVLHWFYLLRGAQIVLNMHAETIRCSFLRPLLDSMAHMENTAAQAIPDSDRISGLFHICASADHDEETSQAYTLAIHSLLNTFTQASMLKKRGEGTVLASFVWPLNLPPKFLDLLSEKRPQAMIVLAHYCVLVFWGETTDSWFMGGWGRYMLETIKDSVPEAWQNHLKWPDEMIK